ncbi:hypothetical protein CXK94_18020 [Stutzerimonas stutzeri]|uniref:Uncharacterized protein n=1 Tax=Stutzerimonas stutzeri TaxID=316 RepID=A0A2N8SX90_STUST|nr:hypothetical protein [Stutzerimonas stutzeri]MCQ4325307.1 hypothetical protein [Stutzerimonas stutzeri]PNG07087.1 hypothetical protein CXK94_18020 [Stutzerimonas stutzeri]
MTHHARLLFTTAALFNWSVALGLLFPPALLSQLLQLTPVEGGDLILRHIASALIAVFGWAYWLVARDPQRWRALAVIGVIGKSLVVALVGVHWGLGTINGYWPALVMADLIYALLFLDFLRRYPLPAHARA